MTTPKKRKGKESVEELLVAEERAFYRKKTYLLQRYDGEFVAIYQGRVIGHGPDDEELARRTFEKLGDVPFYIEKVAKEPVIYEVPS